MLLRCCFEFIRLPEIPPDTPETNPVMCLDDHPPFSKISPDMVVTGCAKRCIEFDVQLGKHVENLKGELCVCVCTLMLRGVLADVLYYHASWLHFSLIFITDVHKVEYGCSIGMSL